MLKFTSFNDPFKSFSLLIFFILFGIPKDSRMIDPSASANAAMNATERNNILLNRQARIYVKNYIQNNQEGLSAIRQRSKVPFELIDSVFKQRGIPVELKYLAVIESELNPNALSPVGARGPWQLMPETAQLLGLKVSSGRDERTVYYKSTVAAAIYLKDLYTEFGDWLLVLAAYNGGPGPVHRAMQMAGSRNFWQLQSYLPAESRNHVKKFIATHYYFEGQGSATTLTKAEWIDYTSHIQPKNEVVSIAVL